MGTLTGLELQNAAGTNQPMDTLVHNHAQDTQHQPADSASPAASKVCECSCFSCCVHHTVIAASVMLGLLSCSTSSAGIRGVCSQIITLLLYTLVLCSWYRLHQSCTNFVQRPTPYSWMCFEGQTFKSRNFYRQFYHACQMVCS